MDMTTTEMIPNLIWTPDLFGPQEIWATRHLDPRHLGLVEFGIPGEIWAPQENHYMAFTCND